MDKEIVKEMFKEALEETVREMSKYLRRCPCCNSESEIHGDLFLWGSGKHVFYGYEARCKNPECGVQTRFFETPREAIEAWNKRTGLKEEAVFHESVTPDPEETFFLVPHCPCCGGAAHISTPSFGWIGEVGKFSISCSDYSNCGFMTREHDELLYAVEEWNRR